MKFRRDLFHYEAPEDGGGLAEDISDEDLANLVDDSPDETQATAQEEKAWALSQDDWAQTVNYLQQTAPILQAVAEYLPQMQRGLQQQPSQTQQPQQDEIDPFDPESVTTYIQNQIQSGLQQAVAQQIGPYEEMLNMQAAEKGEQLARQELEQIESQIGKFDRDSAFLIAAGAIEGGQDPITALRSAAQFSQNWEAKIRAEEREAYKQELQNLRSAPNEVPIGSAAATEIQPVPTGPRRYHDVVDNFLARQNPRSVVG